MKKLLCVLLLFKFSLLIAHEKQIHQYITREAFRLLLRSYPQLATSPMASFIGTNETVNTGNEKSWGAGKIVSGAWMEDEYDIVYHYGIGVNPTFNQWNANAFFELFPNKERGAFTSITHFWNADGGLQAATDLSDEVYLEFPGVWQYWSFTIAENAMQKMYKYRNGDFQNRWLYNGRLWLDCYDYIYYYGSDMQMANLFSLYNQTSTIIATQYLGEDTYWHAVNCPELNYGWSWVFEQLGRMCHLLQDQSVPAHVHCESHACLSQMNCDFYETTVPYFYQLWTGDEIYASGQTFINPYNQWGDPLYYLMYLTNQATDHYASNRSNGDDNFDTNCPGLSQIVSSLGLPVTYGEVNEENCSAMHDKLFPLAIRATAGLLYWFAVESGILTTINVPGDYPTITEALAAATSGQTVKVSNTQTLSSNLTVPTGVTLDFLPPAIVNFNGYYIVSSNTSIVVESGASINCAYLNHSGVRKGLFPNIQAAINYATTGEVVELQGRTYSENPNFSSRSYLTLQGQGQASTTVSGSISVSSSSYISISGLTLSGAFALSYSDHTQVSNVTATGTTLTTNYGGSVNDFGYCTASDIGASFGLNAYGGTGDLYNSSISNGDLAVYLTSNASYNIGTYNVFCNNGLDIYAGDGGYAYAISNFYSYELPGPVYGNVYITGQNDVCGGFMAAPGTETLAGTSSDQPEVDPKSLDAEYLALLRTVREDKLANRYDPNNYREETQNLIDAYASLVNDGAEKRVVKAALSKIAHLYIGLDEKSKFRDYATETLLSGNFNTFAPYFKRYLIWDYVDKKDYNAALKLADEVLSAADADNDLSAEMLYEKGLIQKYYLGDANKANEMYASLSSRYPSSPLNKFATVDMNIAIGSSSGEKDVEQTQSVQSGGDELSVYPNPFNPSTKIQFKLKDAGFVSLRVYDMLGREVAVLINEEQQAGTHEAIWDASKQPSGLYFAKLDVLGKSSVHKMLLVK